MAINTQFRNIELAGRVPGGAGIKFLRASVPVGDLMPFAVVRYSRHGQEAPNGLRLDLDKRISLDHFEDEEEEEVLKAAIPKLIDIISEKLRAMDTSIPLDKVVALEREIQSTKERLEEIHEKSLPLLWRHIGLTAVPIIIVAFVSLYTYQIIQRQTEGSIVQLEMRASELSRKAEDLSKDTSNLRNDLNDIRARLDRFIETFVNNPKAFRSALVRPKTSDPKEVAHSLLVTQELLKQAKQKDIPLNHDELKELAEPLLNEHYNSAELNTEVWNAVSEFASAKTFIAAKKYGLPKQPKLAVGESNYFGGGLQNLGDRPLWENTIFVNCQIVIKDGSPKPVLRNVSFFNCDFQIEEHDAGKRLFAALFESPTPAVNVN